MAKRTTLKFEQRMELTFNFIVLYKGRYCGNSPEVREIAEFLQTSTSVVAMILDALEAQGRIRKRPGISRSIEVVGARWVYKKKEEYRAPDTVLGSD